MRKSIENEINKSNSCEITNKNKNKNKGGPSRGSARSP